MDTNLLPIGSIVKLHNYDDYYVILGSFCKINGKLYTYYCCKYPYGLIFDDNLVDNETKHYDIYINQEDIKGIIFFGNINSEV